LLVPAGHDAQTEHLLSGARAQSAFLARVRIGDAVAQVDAQVDSGT
jgi:hypothetical protein